MRLHVAPQPATETSTVSTAAGYEHEMIELPCIRGHFPSMQPSFPTKKPVHACMAYGPHMRAERALQAMANPSSGQIQTSTAGHFEGSNKSIMKKRRAAQMSSRGFPSAGGAAVSRSQVEPGVIIGAGSRLVSEMSSIGSSVGVSQASGVRGGGWRW